MRNFTVTRVQTVLSPQSVHSALHLSRPFREGVNPTQSDRTHYQTDDRLRRTLGPGVHSAKCPKSLIA